MPPISMYYAMIALMAVALTVPLPAEAQTILTQSASEKNILNKVAASRRMAREGKWLAARRTL